MYDMQESFLMPSTKKAEVCSMNEWENQYLQVHRHSQVGVKKPSGPEICFPQSGEVSSPKNEFEK